ncbi:MAG: DUF2630 family protein [Acidimicrobiales bacterium]
MEDAEIVRNIDRLVGDYRYIERQHGGLGLSADQKKALFELQAEIDQSWELLRRRRALRSVGDDPDMPPPRPTRASRGARVARAAKVESGPR